MFRFCPSDRGNKGKGRKASHGGGEQTLSGGAMILEPKADLYFKVELFTLRLWERSGRVIPKEKGRVCKEHVCAVKSHSVFHVYQVTL